MSLKSVPVFACYIVHIPNKRYLQQHVTCTAKSTTYKAGGTEEGAIFAINIKTIMMKTFAISLLLVTALLRIETALSSSHLDDEVPTEKAKKPKLKPPTHLPEVTHRVYMDVGEFSTQNIIPTR